MAFSIYPETILSFLLIVILSFFSALAVSMNIYRVKLIKKTKGINLPMTFGMFKTEYVK